MVNDIGAGVGDRVDGRHSGWQRAEKREFGLCFAVDRNHRGRLARHATWRRSGRHARRGCRAVAHPSSTLAAGHRPALVFPQLVPISFPVRLKQFRRYMPMKRFLALLSFLLISSVAVAQTRGLPDFTELAEKQGPAVVNISTTQVTRGSQAIAFSVRRKRSGLRIFQALHAAQPWRHHAARVREQVAGFRLHHQRRRLHSDQCPCGRWCRRGDGAPDRQA